MPFVSFHHGIIKVGTCIKISTTYHVTTRVGSRVFQRGPPSNFNKIMLTCNYKQPQGEVFTPFFQLQPVNSYSVLMVPEPSSIAFLSHSRLFKATSSRQAFVFARLAMTQLASICMHFILLTISTKAFSRGIFCCSAKPYQLFRPKIIETPVQRPIPKYFSKK